MLISLFIPYKYYQFKLNRFKQILPTSNPTGYCPHCQERVLLVREPIDTFLAIILLCCTFGVGLFIYLIIYYSKKEDRCIHCNTKITQTLPQGIKPIEYLPPKREATYSQEKTSVSSRPTIEKIESQRAKFCPLCGAQLDARNQKFCPNCGSEI
ncbi:MAG: zinc-ribbon domain-containing protein [Candidatus Lokiarchaeota archaeon]|nr:zinc-ribbon domain-containing protein [Candidatus Lokiarchaeota archaeon]MBD3340716.1 zinc-ribbon domain-containing protein [Candidatus Lokiarchaeota archaeon]